MSKRRLLIFFAVCLLLAILWYIFAPKPDSFLPASSGRKTPTAPPPKTVVKSSPATMPSLATPLPNAATQKERFIAAFLTPIAFYGKVVDQHGEPVPDANVSLAANDSPIGGSPSKYTRKTDGSGLFSISGIVGLTLAVEVSKAGYKVIPPDDLKVTSSGLFEYGLSSIKGPYQPNKNTPTIFILHKVGVTEPLIKITEKNFTIRRDGTPLIIALDQQNGHQVILRCWTKDLERPEGQNKYDWNFAISVTGGGLLRREDAFAFEAPTEGYQLNDTINMPATLPFGAGGWSRHAERAYFIRFNDQTFARVNFRMRAGGDHFVVWESFYNPKPGSRNLEYDATKPSPTP